MTLESLSDIVNVKSITGVALVFLMGMVITIVHERHDGRQMRLTQLDEVSLEQKIVKVQNKTSALQKAAQLHPVWTNWRQAKDVAQRYGVDLVPLENNKKRNRNTWVGTLTGEPLVILAVAKRIQESVASELLSLDYMGSRARIEISVFGTDIR